MVDIAVAIRILRQPDGMRMFGVLQRPAIGPLTESCSSGVGSPIRRIGGGEKAKAEVAAVAEGQGAGKRLRKAHAEKCAVWVGGAFAAPRPEPVKLERAAAAAVDFDVGQQVDLEAAALRRIDDIAPLQKAAHFARVTGGLRQEALDGAPGFQHTARVASLAGWFQVSSRQKRGDTLPCQSVPEQSGSVRELIARAESLQRESPLTPASLTGLAVAAVCCAARRQP